MAAYESATSRLVQQELGACALIQDLLPLYIEGEVTPASRDLIAEHLAHCDRCAGFLAGARSIREQLRRESALRDTTIAHDYTARQAIVTGQRRLMALVLGIFGGLCLAFVVAFVASGFFSGVAPAPVPIPSVSDGPVPLSDEQRLEAELHRRAMEEAGMLVWDPQTNQFIEQGPAGFPRAAPAPQPSPTPVPRP